ncbi:hypothetical protein B7494_g1317 [Chlorociboria aeruginascens]|nr:hypothetical protein B7494_g1317 [Chlorociboria aeruginascens]
MPTSPSPDFKIHVDPSCLTDSTDLKMPAEMDTANEVAERVASNETIVRHDSWAEEAKKEGEHKEATEEENHENGQEQTDGEHERQIQRIEAQIRAAARDVVASIEQETYAGLEDSVLSMQTNENYDDKDDTSHEEGPQLTYDEGTELTYDGSEETYGSEPENHSEHEGGDSSSQHDGDVDDIFSPASGRSARSSLNSCHDFTSSDEQQKQLKSPVVGEEAAAAEEPISRIPSATSYPPVNTTPHTPIKVLSRPPFRTPSSVRAMQMSSPTPSIFSSPRSPRSTKRHSTVSRLGTPTSVSGLSCISKKTPTRFKAKKEYPLVLLHVTVVPLHWPYEQAILSPDLPANLHSVRESWRLLQEKLGDTVLERGILLPHPQESYEVLEERLLEALELPIRPRARILRCGHYMGPLDSELTSDEESSDDFERRINSQGGVERKWCDICGHDVRLEDFGPGAGERRFRVKIYAGNGLMRAGAWAAVWREMERVDVEIEPFVDAELVDDMEKFAMRHKEEEVFREDEFAEEAARSVHVTSEEIREAEEEIKKLEENNRRNLMEEERMREIYGQDIHIMEEPRSQPRPQRSHSRDHTKDDSLAELLLAAFKVAMRDRKNVAIFILSVIVMFLALRPRPVSVIESPIISGPPAYTTRTMEAPSQEAPIYENEPVLCVAEEVTEVAQNIVDAPKAAAIVESIVKVPKEKLEDIASIEPKEEIPMEILIPKSESEDIASLPVAKNAPILQIPVEPQPEPLENIQHVKGELKQQNQS